LCHCSFNVFKNQAAPLGHNLEFPCIIKALYDERFEVLKFELRDLQVALKGTAFNRMLQP